MPGGFPFGPELCNGNSPNASANSGKGTSVTGGHLAYGAWTQLVASTAIDACFMCVRIWPTSNSSFRTFTSIGVGSGGNEVAIVNDLYASSGTAGSLYTEYFFPCSIPAGTRVSAQCCQSAGTDSNNVTVILYDGSFNQTDGFSGVDSIGVTIGSAIATDVDPGSSANVKGAWVQLTASTTRDYCGLMATQGENSTNNAAYTNPGGIDIAIGGSGSEQIIIPDMGMCSQGQPRNSSTATPLVMVPIPAGTRIAARAQQGNNTSGTRVVGLALYGVYQ